MGEVKASALASFTPAPRLPCKRKEGFGAKTAAGAGAYTAAGSVSALGAERTTGGTKGLATGAVDLGVSMSRGAAGALLMGAGMGSGRLLMAKGRLEVE
jgi:hypothetical protein